MTKKDTNPLHLSFWFKVGMDLYKNRAPNNINKHLILLAIFYSANEEYKMADNLFQSALSSMKSDLSHSKILGLNMYGRMLIKNQETKQKGFELVKISEDMAKDGIGFDYKTENLFFDIDKTNPFQ